MATNVVMPKMGESITEGTILRWLKKEGEAVQKDEPILEISTDKVDTEVPSPVAGTLLKILAQEKQTIAVGEPIASIGTNGEAAGTGSAAASEPVAKQAAPAQTPQSAPPQSAPPQQAPVQQAPVSQATPSSNGQTGQGQAVVMPKMGESIAEGTVLRWLKKEGDKVEKDEPILEISTDKVDTEVPAPFAGTLSKIVAQEKETVAVGATIAFISGGSGAPAQSSGAVPAAPPQATQAAAAPQQTVSQQTAPAPQAQAQAQAQAKAWATPAANDDRFYSPLVKNIAKTEGISSQELAQISGTGMGGRVNKTDMLKYVEARKSGTVPSYRQQVPSQQAASPSQQQPSFAAQAPQPMSVPSFASSGQPTTIIPMDNIRQRIAEHMVRSVQTSPHVTSISEVDVTNIINYQKKNKDSFQQRYGVKLTLTPIFVECMI
ncbi:MAG TPA: biotin/lipoyl-containing protein, partial [Candidatus Kapabacteria bacterium]